MTEPTTLRQDFEMAMREANPEVKLGRNGPNSSYTDQRVQIEWKAYQRAYKQFHDRIKKSNRLLEPRRPFINVRVDTETGRLRTSGKPHMHNQMEAAMAEADRLHTLHGNQFITFAAVYRTEKPKLEKVSMPDEKFQRGDRVSHDATRNGYPAYGPGTFQFYHGSPVAGTKARTVQVEFDDGISRGVDESYLTAQL